MEASEGDVIGLGVAAGPDRVEHRSYESLIVSAVENQAHGMTVLRGLALGALESCAGMYARAFASAAVEPQTAVSVAVTPAALATIARGLIRHGESLHVIDVDRAGRLALREVASWNVEGGPDPATWRYRVSTAGPSMTATRHVSADGVIHPKYSIDPARPWAGRSALSWAAETGRLAAALERSLADESGGPVGNLIPIPTDAGDDGEDDPLASLKRDIRGLRGKAALVESVASGWGEGRAAAPQKDWLVRRLGAAPPDSLIALREAVTVTIATACGIPAVLVLDGGDGTARREAFRQFLHGSVQPVARLVTQELSTKLEQPVRLTFRALHAADVTGRARAWRSLVGAKGEMPDTDARRLTGLD